MVMVLFLFYKWASSPNYPEKEYSKIFSYQHSHLLKSDSIFKIITYNIGYLSDLTNNKPIQRTKNLFKSNLAHVISLIKKSKPSIIAFQEIDYNSSRSFKINQEKSIAEIGYNYVGRAVNWDKKYVPFPYYPIGVQFGRVYSGQSVISNYKIIKQQRIVLTLVTSDSFYRRSFYLDWLAQVCKIQLNDKIIVVINVHLEAYNYKTRKTQTEEIIKLYNSYKDKYPTILLGDFNSDIKYHKATINKIIGLKNIGNAAFTASNYLNTYSSKNPTNRIDYIFFNKNFIEYISGKILSEFGDASDHLPVQMTFKLRSHKYLVK